MDQTRIDAVSAELKKLNPFEWLCVNSDKGHIGTYMVNSRVGDDVDLQWVPIFYRRVDLKTQKTVELYFARSLSQDARDALEEHYNEQYVFSDALEQMWQFGVDAHRCVMEPGVPPMPTHSRFGMCFFYADVDELHLADGESFITV